MKHLESTSTQRWARAVIAIAAAILMVGLTACNTVRGVGEDVSAAGQSLADVAAD